MLFASIEFFLFLSLVLLVWHISPIKQRWLVLLLASYVFYGAFDFRFLFFLLFITCANWYLAMKMSSCREVFRRRGYLFILVSVDLIPLFICKYFNFFSTWFTSLLDQGGVSYLAPHIDIVLPLGISFYSFQAIAYSYDVYKGKLQPETHLGSFALFLSFFPKLISGPIERGANLLHQLKDLRPVSYEVFLSSCFLISFGLFKKLVIADRLGMYVEMVFSNPTHFYGKTAIVAAWLFSLQIYCDFSAYMDIAIGSARMFGIELSRNFFFPYFAVSITEFWRRWHITLTSWFRDYVYIPMGGNRVPTYRFSINIMSVFLLSGLWHGASLTFIFWGGLHGLVYLIEKVVSRLFSGIRKVKNGGGRAVLNLSKIFLTFNIVTLAWVFFRARSLEDAFILIQNMFVNFSFPVRMMSSQFTTALVFGLAILFVAMETVLYLRETGRSRFFGKIPGWTKYPAFIAGLLLISLLGVGSTEFIYFHF